MDTESWRRQYVFELKAIQQRIEHLIRAISDIPPAFDDSTFFPKPKKRREDED